MLIERTLAATLLLTSLALAGCAGGDPFIGNAVTLNQDLVTFDSTGDASAVRNIQCGEVAELEVTATDVRNGSLNVQVKEGGAVPIESAQLTRASTFPYITDLAGNRGTWTLTVTRTLEFDAEFTVTLRC